MDYTRYVYLTALKICCPLISRYRYVTKLHNCQELRSTAVLGLRCSESYNNLFTMTYFISANIEWLYLPGIMQICTSYNGSHIIYSLEIIEYRVSRCLQMQCASKCSHKCDKRGNICVRVFRTAPLSSFIFSFRKIVRVRLHSCLFKWQRGFMGCTLKQVYSSNHPLLRYKLWTWGIVVRLFRSCWIILHAYDTWCLSSFTNVSANNSSSEFAFF